MVAFPPDKRAASTGYYTGSDRQTVRYEVDVRGKTDKDVVTIDFSIKPLFDDSNKKVVLLIPEGREVSQVNREKQYELEQAIRRNDLLTDIAQILVTHNLDSQAIFNLATQKLAQLFEGSCSIRLLAEDRQALELVSFYQTNFPSQPGEHTPSKIRKTSLPLNQTVEWEIINKEQPLLLPQFQSTTNAKKAVQTAFPPQSWQGSICASILVPLRIPGNVIGIVGVCRRQTAKVYIQRDILLLQDLADRIALAVSNARLYESAYHELVERRRVEEELKASLKEKEVLLREIHHRVKNNLQIIASLLFLQAESLEVGNENKENKHIRQLFMESENRVRAMALLHEKLYDSNNLARIDFPEYVVQLATAVFEAYNISAEAVELKFNFDVPECLLDIDTAISCGLILNELISNSLKYAFPTGQRGILEISLGNEIAEGNYKMTVADNGPGLAPDFNISQVQTLGLQLVALLVKQLGTHLEITSPAPQGVSFSFRFSPKLPV